MRAIRSRDHAYIWNAWSDGKKIFQAESMEGLTWKALFAAGKTDPAIRQRVDHYLYRTPEEFYWLENDPGERRNLIGDPDHGQRIEAMRAQLLEEMKRTGDPLAEALEKRGDRSVYERILARLEAGAPAPVPGR